MGQTSIVECNKCGGLLLVADGQKSRTCPYCGTRVDVHRAKRLAKADNAFEASEILRKIKGERQTNARKIKLK